MPIQRLPVHFDADPKKVILLYLDPGESERLDRFSAFVDKLSDQQADDFYKETTTLFGHRHRKLNKTMIEFAQRGLSSLNGSFDFSEKQQLVFGSFLAKEYSVEAAALFNPSIVQHHDQTNLSAGETRFVLSLRSVGEGHISSVGFMEGVIDGANHIRFTTQGPWRTQGVKSVPEGGDDDHYDITFGDDIPLSERVIFPQAKSESMGIEDLRLVRFTDGGQTKYMGTYTAYDGKTILSKMMETTDFQHFNIRKLKGSEIDNKGIAFFPRKINGQYVVSSRQGGEKLTIMRSDDYMTWNHKDPLQQPTRGFELVQIGNCGSPIETAEGWLMITHHVGPMRRYTLGVTLLDLDKPHKVISILDKPLMEPLESEREGYVPNVLYTCGWMQHGDNILIPYAMSDVACGFASLNTGEILETLLKNKR